jgi:MFS family permease
MGAAAAALNIPVGIHLAVSGALFSTIGLLTYRFLLRDPEPATAPIPAEVAAQIPAEQPAIAAAVRRPWTLLAVLGLIAIAGTIIEDSGITWSTFYLTDTLNAPTSAVGLGLMAFLTAQFFGRVTGDALVNRFGQRIVTQGGASLIVVGMGVALAFPSTPGSIAGFAGAGLGVATLVPAAMHAANEIPGLRVGSGLTIVTWLMRLGFLFSPLIIGGIADAYGLRLGLVLAPVVGLIILALSPVFSGRQRASID